MNEEFLEEAFGEMDADADALFGDIDVEEEIMPGFIQCDSLGLLFEFPNPHNVRFEALYN